MIQVHNLLQLDSPQQTAIKHLKRMRGHPKEVNDRLNMNGFKILLSVLKLREVVSGFDVLTFGYSGRGHMPPKYLVTMKAKGLWDAVPCVGELSQKELM